MGMIIIKDNVLEYVSNLKLAKTVGVTFKSEIDIIIALADLVEDLKNEIELLKDKRMDKNYKFGVIK